MNNGTENLEWARQKIKQLASKRNIPIDHTSFSFRSDVVIVVIKSRGEEISGEINEALFEEDENMRQALQEKLEEIVIRIKSKVRQNALL